MQSSKLCSVNDIKATEKIEENSYRISSDDKGGGNEEELLALAYVLKRDKAALPNIDTLDGHLLRREAGVGKPLLKPYSAFK